MISVRRSRTSGAVAALVMGACALVSSGFSPTGANAAPAAACPATRWVAAWSLSPSDALAEAPPLAAMTLRSTAYPHVGGTAARVHLSNRLGLGTVTIGTATIGQQSSGAGITPGTLLPLTFGGSPTITIPAGGEVVSDPVTMAVTQFHQLTISLYIALATAPVTQHVLATQTSYTAVGDMTSDTTGTAFIGTPVAGVTPALPQGVDLVSGVDVLTGGDTGTVSAFGDSITDGFQDFQAVAAPSPAQVDQNTRYPDDLARRLAAAGRKLSVVDDGISGNQLLVDATVPIFGPSGLHREQPDLLAQAGVTTVILLEGINDIGMSEATAPALEAGYAQFTAAAHAAGLKVLLGTITPSGGTEPATEGDLAEPTREALNAYIRSGVVGDGVVDFDAAVRDPADPGQLNPAYDGSDHLHLNAAGYQAMADAVPLDKLTGPACATTATTTSTTSTTSTTKVTAVQPKKTTRRPTVRAKARTRATQSHPSAATGTLAYTGMPAELAVIALSALAAATVVSRRRKLGDR